MHRLEKNQSIFSENLNRTSQLHLKQTGESGPDIASQLNSPKRISWSTFSGAAHWQLDKSIRPRRKNDLEVVPDSKQTVRPSRGGFNSSTRPCKSWSLLLEPNENLFNFETNFRHGKHKLQIVTYPKGKVGLALKVWKDFVKIEVTCFCL